ncbi:MAG: DNA topoisomerase I [Candidatus Hermodarchaeia archaeon]|jgi:DNA topoisomerase-1
MEQLQHRGVLVPPRYQGKNLLIKIRGKKITLTHKQEEMALAWVKKLGTPYVEDSVFTKNFYHDFSKELDLLVQPKDVDYYTVLSFVEKKRIWRTNLSKVEKKHISAKRKSVRETNKAHYGYAYVDGDKMEIANYTVEPSSIFIGRGKHPLRGSWKEGPKEEDVELNLSPKAPIPPGHWKGIVWQPHSMWIARWRDKLNKKIKYVWLSESSSLKQKKDIEKFNKAKELHQNIRKVQRHILKNLNTINVKRRKIATVCFLIYHLKIRVGDEKDPDEADTVGASTLRPEHIMFNSDGTVTFKFLGKDSIPHLFKTKLPKQVINNLKAFIVDAQNTLFDGVSSKHVSDFLDEVMTGLSAKVFRTFYASNAARSKLEKTPSNHTDPEYIKKHTLKMANLEATKLCNHRRSIPRTWQASLEKKKERLKVLRKRARVFQNKNKTTAQIRMARYKETLCKKEANLKIMNEKLFDYKQQLIKKKQQGQKVDSLEKRINQKRKSITLQKQRLKNYKLQHKKQMKKLNQRSINRKQRDKVAIDKQKYRIKLQKETRDYNLTTAQKSYIDPRIFYHWGKKHDYDWKKYYSKTLQKKFSWIESNHTS